MALALVKPNQNPTNNLDEAEYFVKELPLVGYKDDYRLIHKLSVKVSCKMGSKYLT